MLRSKRHSAILARLCCGLLPLLTAAKASAEPIHSTQPARPAASGFLAGAQAPGLAGSSRSPTGSLSAAARQGAPAAPGRASDEQANAEATRQALSALAQWVQDHGGQISALVLDSANGATWAQASPDAALNPASNMKILTAAVALERLGPEYRYSTGLYGTIRDDRIESLVLAGHGDPSLELGDLWTLAHAVKQRGVRQVGQVAVDQSRFDRQFVPPAFEQQPWEWASFRAPVSAVAIERNAVTLHVKPAQAGSPARVWFQPPGVVEVQGSVQTRRPGSGQSIALRLEPNGTALKAHVGGHVSERMPVLRFPKRLEDPRLVPGLALTAMLKEMGVAVERPPTLGAIDGAQRLSLHRSEPLSVLLQRLGKRSDNFYAEMLLKTLAAEAGQTPASSADGCAVVRQWLAQHDLLGPQTRLENGSGLFDANRLSARSLAGTLSLLSQTPELYPEFAAQLSVGGVDGTLRKRFRKLKPPRTVRAKTGTLAKAIALSGYVLRDAKRPLVFSILVEGIAGRAGVIRRKMDRVVVAIAGG